MKEVYFTKEEGELFLKIAKSQPATLQGMANSIYFSVLGNAILTSPSPIKKEVNNGSS
jgi:hypothetical protein